MNLQGKFDVKKNDDFSRDTVDDVPHSKIISVKDLTIDRNMKTLDKRFTQRSPCRTRAGRLRIKPAQTASYVDAWEHRKSPQNFRISAGLLHLSAKTGLPLPFALFSHPSLSFLLSFRVYPQYLASSYSRSAHPSLLFVRWAYRLRT